MTVVAARVFGLMFAAQCGRATQLAVTVHL
jgi:hypothetical protein